MISARTFTTAPSCAHRSQSVHVHHTFTVSRPRCQQQGLLGGAGWSPAVVVALAPTVLGSRSPVSCQATASALDRVSEPHLQLATAKLPAGADPGRFAQMMYQWAATLTQNGANLPFVSPLKADKLPTGFQISMLRRSDKTKSFGSAGDIVATVEQQDGVGPVLFVRFFEGAVAQDNKAAGWVPPADPMQRLELVLDSCKDVDVIMANMPQAIRIAAKASTEP